MKIKIPVGRLLGLIPKVIKAAKGGISKEEAADLGHELLEIALAILGQALPEDVEVKL